MAKQVTLALDSSGLTLLAGVQDGEKIYSFRRTGIKQEQFVLPLLERTLAKAGAELPDVARVCLVRGPGRFTGIRISLTLASMLKELNGAAVFGATLFEILYQQVQASASFQKWQAANPTGAVAVVLHAFREEYFLQIFDRAGGVPQWLSVVQLKEQLAAYPQPLYVAGTDKEGALLAGLLGEGYTFAPLADCKVRAQTLVSLAENPKYEKDALEPLYLKPARFELNP